MKITRKQLRQLIKEEYSKVTYESSKPDDSEDQEYQDDNGDGVPDQHDDTMDPDQKVSFMLNKIRDILEDAHHIANSAPDHQNKGEGFAMAELQMVVDDLHQMYGTEYWRYES